MPLVTLTLGEHQAKRPGRLPAEGMMRIAGRNVRYAVGLNRPLRTRCRDNSKKNNPLQSEEAQLALISQQARPEGFEPPTLGSEDRCSIQLSYGRVRLPSLVM
jgi:hypothetical protein